MPGIRGAQSIPAIRKKCPTTRIIMVTAFGSIDHAVNAMQAGADDYLVKPFRKEALLQLVQRHIEEQKFLRNAQKKGLGETLSAISNPIRRSILELLRTESSMRFMEITRALDIEDHTKVNFHLKNLRHSGLVDLNENRGYQLTAQGRQVLDALSLIGTE
jgi:FixJ family two-component response regulator